jgi:hypothetical protein
MDSLTTETDLYRKLALTYHLNVPERRLLPSGRVRISCLMAAIEAHLSDEGWYPKGLRPEHDFGGGLIELRADKTCQIYWKSEFSMLRYELDAVGQFASAALAIGVWLRAMFPDNIDGLSIDWDS